MKQSERSNGVQATLLSGGGSPGAILRRCREFHGFSLEDAAEATKIGVTHLRALEEDRVGDFANEVYLKGFLRIYTAYLGLNSEDVSRMYGKLFSVPEEPAANPPPLSTKPTWVRLLRKLLLPTLLLAAILVAGYLYRLPAAPAARELLKKEEPVRALQMAVQPARSSAEQSGLPLPSPPAGVKKKEELPQIAAAPPANRPSEPSRRFLLKLKATQNGMLTGEIDGVVIQGYELLAGDVIEWRAERRISLELGNSGGVEIELNGKPQKIGGTPGKRMFVSYDAKDAER